MSFRFKRGAFTLIEILVVVGILALLAACLLPAFLNSKENARRSACQSNMHQIGLAFLQYTEDFDGVLARTSLVRNLGTSGAPRFDVNNGYLAPYLKNTQIYVCPSDTAGATSGDSYAYNSCLGFGASLSSLGDTTKWMLIAEEDSTKGSTDDAWQAIQNRFAARHFTGSNLQFVDGHAKWYKSGRISADGYQIGGKSPVIATTACP